MQRQEFVPQSPDWFGERGDTQVRIFFSRRLLQVLEVSTQRNPVYESTELRVLDDVIDQGLDDVSKKD
jgi:hypothetical protein